MGKPVGYIIIRCLGHKSIKMRPGDSLRIGRHHSNDLVLSDGTVSRFHAVIEWDKDNAFPTITDNDSANGVEIEDDLIDGRELLSDDTQIGIGDFTVIVQWKGRKRVDERTRQVKRAHLIDDGPSVVRLFSESTRRVRGSFKDVSGLHRVLIDLEASERTGTLKIRDELGITRMIFGQGKVITAARGDQEGMQAFVEIMRLEHGDYEFSADLEPSEENLDLSIREYLEKDGDSTMRFKKSPLHE